MFDEYVLYMKDIDKSFPGVHALKNVSLALMPGEVHALMGENGAGKSTLTKILGGIYKADSGEIYINGNKVNINSVKDAIALEISIIHQELCLVKDITVAENIFLGAEYTKGPLKFVDYKTMYKKAQVILDGLNAGIKADEIVRKLSIAQQQTVEIAKAVYKKSKIIVMDEPTSSLTEREISSLFKVIDKLKKEGTAIIYISHRMEETFNICDTVTVLRDGGYVGTKSVKETSNDELIKMMVGRDLNDMYKMDKIVGGENILEVKNLNNKYLKDVSFNLKKGEILGFSGLVGAGRTEVARAIFGIDKINSGEIYLDGQKITIKNPQDAINHGLSFVTEDRKGNGLILNESISNNITLTVLNKFIKFIKVDKKKEKKIVDDYIKKLAIKTPGPQQLCRNLSGGNQQKVVISKWLAREPRILILDEPTRGIDVGAKTEIYKLIKELAQSGITVIMISSELTEIINISSRVVVMYEGRITKILDASKEELTQEKLMIYATGGISNGTKND